MSKERARRRAVRDHEAALRTSARAAEVERRERRAARSRAVHRITTDRLPRLTPTGRPTGALARRRRAQTALLAAMLVAANVLVWFASGDWAVRFGALVVTLLVGPVAAVLVPRRR